MHCRYRVLRDGRYVIEPDAGGTRSFTLPGERVLEVREGRTMRAHCFHCWSDCEWRALDGSERRLCDGCVSRVGTENVRRLDDDERWDRGPRDT